MIGRPAVRMRPAVWFAYSPNRKGEHPQLHLKDFRGTLQADAFAGFNALYEDPERGIVEAACWAHVRRKFYDLQQAHASPIAAEAIQRIGALYAIESEIRGRPPDERREIRQARARPLLDSMHEWLQATLAKLSKHRGNHRGRCTSSLGSRVVAPQAYEQFSRPGVQNHGYWKHFRLCGLAATEAIRNPRTTLLGQAAARK